MNFFIEKFTLRDEHPDSYRDCGLLSMQKFLVSSFSTHYKISNR